jgi:hypothetical protein
VVMVSSPTRASGGAAGAQPARTSEASARLARGIAIVGGMERRFTGTVLSFGGPGERAVWVSDR